MYWDFKPLIYILFYFSTIKLFVLYTTIQANYYLYHLYYYYLKKLTAITIVIIILYYTVHYKEYLKFLY